MIIKKLKLYNLNIIKIFLYYIILTFIVFIKSQCVYGIEYVSTFVSIDGYTYYFDNEGKIVDGVQKIEGKYYYFVDNKLQYAQTDGTYYYGRLS